MLDKAKRQNSAGRLAMNLGRSLSETQRPEAKRIAEEEFYVITRFAVLQDEMNQKYAKEDLFATQRRLQNEGLDAPKPSTEPVERMKQLHAVVRQQPQTMVE
jgi:hypothetical protein